MQFIDVLAKHFDLQPRSGWTAISSRLIFGYGTKRIAKLLPDGELQFTIGATERGRRINLNPTIRVLAHQCGFNVLDRHSTSGTRKHAGDYPGINTNRAQELAIRVLALVEGAAMQGAMSDDT